MILILLLVGAFLTVAGVSASSIDDNSTNLAENNIDDLDEIIIKAQDNDTIYLESVTYSGEHNTQIIIDKSLNFVGGDDTVIDGGNERSIFTINDNVKVSFKNIKFVNASKTGNGVDIFGGAFEIHNADVTFDDCQFISNSINYGKSENIYGAAISNEGNLTILNSIFIGNSLNSAYLHSGFGGAIYNNGRLYINNTSFIRSRGGENSNGAVLYNNNVALINNSVIADTYSFEDSMGSAIFNNGDLTLLNSVVENNTIERNNFNFIFGNIFNSGRLVASRNIFKNNTAYYKQPNSGYEGCPTIYNVGELNLSYNAFINNIGGFKKVYRDVFLNGGQSVYIDNNWWGSNDNPFTTQAINVDMANAWLVVNVTPSYSAVKIDESLDIIASWMLSNGQTPQFLFPFEITFSDDFGQFKKCNLADGNCTFTFNNTQNRGEYTVNICLDLFKQSVNVDVGKLKTYIVFSLNKDVLNANDDLIVNITLYDENSNPIGEKISLSLNNKRTVVNLDEDGESVVFTNLLPNAYEINMEYAGNDVYTKSSAKTNVTVRKYPVNINIEELGDVYVDENFSVDVYLATPEVEGAANLYIDGVFKQVVYLKHGDTLIEFSNFDEGKYNFTVETHADDYYEQTNASTIVTVLKYRPQLNITSTDIFINENETLTINALDDFKGEVILSINGINHTLFLNNKTTDITLTNLGAGIYDVDLIFMGNAKFTPQNASTSFEVAKHASDLIVNIGENIIAVNMLPANCSGAVSVYVNQRHYRLNLTDGKAVFDVEFDEGTNYIYVIYEGNDYYEQSSFNTTRGVGEAVAIIGENITFWQYNDFNYTVQVFEKNGYAMRNIVIAITVNSKTYNVKTDEMGMAILPLNLNEGNYEIVSVYENLTAINYLTIKPIAFNLTAINIVCDENTVITAEFNSTITGKVNFTLSNGLTEVIDISNGKAIFTVGNLTFGIWEVSAYYTNDLFNSDTVKTAFEVEKLNSTIVLDIKEAFVGEDETITAILNDLTGNVTFIVDGTPYTVNIADHTAVLVLSGLSESKHLLEVIYNGDDNHKMTSLTDEFYIKTQKTDIILSVNETAYGEEIKVIAMVNGSGVIKFTINGITKISQIKDGMAYASFGGFDVGKYIIDAQYSGDNQFLSTSTSADFNVIKAKSTIELYADDVVLDENIMIHAKLSENATGKVSFSMTGYYSPRDKNVIDSVASWYITPLESGVYEVIATYGGDSNYYSSTATFMLNVSQTRSFLTVSVDDVSNRDNVVIRATLVSAFGENITGTVNIQFNSKTYQMNVRDGKGTLNLGKFSPANYTGVAGFDGSDRFAPSKANFEFMVSDYLLESILTCEDVIKYYNNDAKFTITLTNAKNKGLAHQTIYVTVKGIKDVYVTDDEGKVYLDINNTLEKYDVYVEFDGSDSYYPSNASGSVEVLTTIESADVIKLYGTETQYFALFRDINGRALGNTDVVFTIANKNYTYTTLPNGIVRLNINLNPGVYPIIAYNPQSSQQVKTSLTIFNRIMENIDVTNYFGVKSTYKVRAFGIDGKPVGEGETVTFKVNGKTYTVKTNKNGYATLSVKLNPKQYVVTAEFNGTKVSNVITVKPVLTTKITSNKKTKKTKFTAKLVNTKGKALNGKKITFKINGKKYTTKTNKKGMASINIKLTLKKGTYKIYTIYGNSKVVNTIRVK